MKGYYMRAETADGDLHVGMEIESIDANGQEYYIERYGLRTGDRIKLYDLSNPTQTIEVKDGNTGSDGTDGALLRDEADGQVRSDE
jgi:hypothetical protein